MESWRDGKKKNIGHISNIILIPGHLMRRNVQNISLKYKVKMEITMYVEFEYVACYFEKRKEKRLIITFRVPKYCRYFFIINHTKVKC